jgi:hypothetical protein
MIAIALLFVTGCKFEFKNVYSDAVACLVRQHLRIVAEGDIDIIRLSAIGSRRESSSSQKR